MYPYPYPQHRRTRAQYLPRPVEARETATDRSGLLRRLARSAADRWYRRRMVATLEAMDDKLLRDIGLYRGDINRVVKGFDETEVRMAPVAMPVEAFKKAA